MPTDTNLLAKIYQEIKRDHWFFLQTHLWDYRGREVRETRGQELILAAWETLQEG
jgi:hypothetical protein